MHQKSANNTELIFFAVPTYFVYSYIFMGLIGYVMYVRTYCTLYNVHISYYRQYI